ncbi:hypothetical protein H4W29_005505 [Rhizobium viscosum]|uniref:Uncharacterized protein n=1 Tax=Rhizobium viscosum TaxID=1673 RepID=A0ABR9IYG3_RHIVS|nr:hypothetical protein [Rhizobium viscosum]
MTRASAGRIKRRQETDSLSWVATRIERARNSKRKLPPDKLARGMVTGAWKEALRRTHQCFGRSIDRFFRLEVSPEGSDLASINLSSVPYQVNVSIGMPTFLDKITRLLAARSAPFSDGQVPGQHGPDVTVPYDESVLRMNRAFFGTRRHGAPPCFKILRLMSIRQSCRNAGHGSRDLFDLPRVLTRASG